MKIAISSPDPDEPSGSSFDLDSFAVEPPAIPAAPVPLQPLSLEEFNIEQPLADASVELPTTLRIGRPGNNEWAMVMPYDVSPGFYVYLPPGGGKGDVYLLTPMMAGLIPEVRKLVMPRIWSNPQGVKGLWLLNYPDPGNKNNWNDSAWNASLEAQREWRRIVSDQGIKQYIMFKPINPPPPPDWPERSEAVVMIAAAFQDRIIRSPEHPVYKALKML